MSISEREFEQDPTLMGMRLYDKINPHVDGFEDVNGPGTRFSGRAYWAFDETVPTDSLALANLEDNTYD